MGKLTGKVAVVTGASKGIGAGIAKALAAEGASVVVNYASSREGADKVVAEITGKGGKAIAVGGDVSKAADVKSLFDATQKAFGRFDILVNNAGVYKFAPIEEVTEADYRWHFDINVLGPLLTIKEALKHFPARGRLDHQCQLGRGFQPDAYCRRLLRHQGRARHDHPRARARTRREKCAR